LSKLDLSSLFVSIHLSLVFRRTLVPLLFSFPPFPGTWGGTLSCVLGPSTSCRSGKVEAKAAPALCVLERSTFFFFHEHRSSLLMSHFLCRTRLPHPTMRSDDGGGHRAEDHIHIGRWYVLPHPHMVYGCYRRWPGDRAKPGRHMDIQASKSMIT
jgi:hypothetical protein